MENNLGLFIIYILQGVKEARQKKNEKSDFAQNYSDENFS